MLLQIGKVQPLFYYKIEYMKH